MRRFGVLLALLAVAAAGCSKERAGDLPSSSAPPPVTTTSAAPATSTAATSNRTEAAAREYFAMLERAGREGDVAPLDARVDKDCSCRQQVDYLREEAKAGRRVTTRYVVESVAPEPATATHGTAAVTFSASASEVVDSSGKQVRTLPGVEHVGVELTFRFTADSWVLERVVRL